MKAASLFLFGALTSIAAAQTVPSRTPFRLARGESLQVVVYGTSLTAGGDWSPQLMRSLQKRYAGQLQWTNAAGSGMNSDWGVANLDERVLAKRPDVVFIEFAVNDAVARFNLPLSRAKTNLETMIARLRRANPKIEIVLQITNPVIDRPEGNSGYRPHLDAYFKMVRKVAASKRTVLIDNEDGWRRILDQGDEIYHRLVPDGLHPNPQGYADVVTPTLLKRLGVRQADALARQEEIYDVLVYGGTSAAVAAAVQVRRMGKRVLLLSPDEHLGGLTSGGLGWTDSGDIRTVGGLSREFYHRVWEHYGKPEGWSWQRRETFGGAAQNSAARDEKTQTMWVFEPHVAERIFDRMIEENDVPVVYGRLDLDGGVYKRGSRIVGVRTTNGQVYGALSFIDATYEGDLMAKAGVSYTVGRESSGLYGETFNGSQAARAIKNQLPKGISPYRRKADPRSGLLPGVEPAISEADGNGDPRIQAYCYRMCLTNVPENRIPLTKPKGYRESDYEILFRAIEAGQKGDFFKLSPIPNRKTDSNNEGGISTDLIGRNYGYPEAGYRERERIAQAHEHWQRGLIWTLQNSRRVPETIRARYAEWGLPKDEFVDNGGWPSQIYVREARRMRGESVVTEVSLLDKASVARPVGMGSYKMDSHNARRVVGPDGSLMNEGDVQQSTNGPYGIDYGSMVPRESECSNLLVPVCLSATHIAYGSIRMEPVFMILGQSAATAAVLSLGEAVPVQKLDYGKLKERLRTDGQVLSL
ncbi:FAD-dependent oxidoreductase [bacterium]|nr:MAG: FAD-dependent oxidoreductase [bacterium]